MRSESRISGVDVNSFLLPHAFGRKGIHKVVKRRGREGMAVSSNVVLLLSSLCLIVCAGCGTGPMATASRHGLHGTAAMPPVCGVLALRGGNARGRPRRGTDAAGGSEEEGDMDQEIASMRVGDDEDPDLEEERAEVRTAAQDLIAAAKVPASAIKIPSLTGSLESAANLT